MILRRQTLDRFARFITVSAVAFPLNLAVTVFVHEVLGASEELAFAVALAVVFLFSFAACRYVIYRATSGDPRRQLLKYAMFSAVFRLSQYLAFFLVRSVFDTQYLLTAILVLGASFLFKFRVYGDMVFTDGRPGAS